MIELQAEQEKKVRCFLVYPYGNNTIELQNLTETLELEVSGLIVLPQNPSEGNVARYGIGTGKAQEIVEKALELESDCIIFDTEITPTRQRNWEKLAKIPVFDRQEVILRIFASRARTKEAVLQVELARLTYSLPRLAHSYGDLARQRGGSYGSKGAGETKLELDKRGVQQKIVQVKRELEKVVKERNTQRKRREKIPLPTCALVGYTNAGKSSLLNVLTGSNVLAEDKLFATLDPTTRRLSLKGGTNLLLTDTVGFISNLPHNLVDAFKSTLEEAAKADLLLLVVDASDINAKEQYKTVCNVLEEIGATNNNRITVLNKIDLLKENDLREANLQKDFSNTNRVSTFTKEGLPELLENICDKLAGEEESFKIPYSMANILELIRKTGTISKEEWLDDYIFFTGRVSKNSGLKEKLQNYKI
ncbi:MAG: GTPase HflX [Spirochaetaceae bacterium]|nr:GTPase HflX [Spirochaetaceae bacterium]